MDSLSLLFAHVDIGEIFRLEKRHEGFLRLLLELIVDQVFKCFSRDTLAVTLLAFLVTSVQGLLFLFHFFIFFLGHRLRLIGRFDGELEFHVGAGGNCEGEFKVLIIFNDDPVVSIVVTQLNILVDVVLGSKLLGLGHEGGVVGGEHTLDYRAHLLGAQIETNFYIQLVVRVAVH